MKLYRLMSCKSCVECMELRKKRLLIRGKYIPKPRKDIITHCTLGILPIDVMNENRCVCSKYQNRIWINLLIWKRWSILNLKRR